MYVRHLIYTAVRAGRGRARHELAHMTRTLTRDRTQKLQSRNLHSTTTLHMGHGAE